MKSSVMRHHKAITKRARLKANHAGYSRARTFLCSPIFLLVTLLAPGYFFLARHFLSQKFLIFNIDALGHYLMEFTGLLQSLPRDKRKHNLRVMFLGFGDGSRANRYLLSKLESLPAAEGISFVAIPPVLWIPLAALSETRPPMLEHLLTPMNPTFSEYTPLKKVEVLATISPEEKACFERYMDLRLPAWRQGYCVLGIRDSAYYGDTDSHRNSPPTLYLDAVKVLLDRGIPVVRMGRKVVDAFPIVHKNFLDIGFEGGLDDYLDVMLWAHASIAVGDSTGLTDAVALLGGKTFCATYPMDPRAFISARNYWFAFQELREVTTGRILKISEVVGLMNEGWNIGDQGLLSKRGLANVRMAQSEIARATDWFLSEIESEAAYSISNEQQAFMAFLAKHDQGSWLHYRKDVLFGARWLGMESKIYPGCISRVL